MLTKRRLALLILMAAILIAAPVLAITSSRSDSYNEDKGARVLTLWQIDCFEGGKGSRARYLKDAADNFFKGDGVYVTVTSLSAQAARDNISSGNIPDMISYGAGFYGIESLINDRDFAYKCWCRGAYFIITLDNDADFADVDSLNTVVNSGRDNLAAACALFEGLSGAAISPPTVAYVELINKKYKYLLGTQRDLYRLETRGAEYSAIPVTSFNDLYQNISILCADENYSHCISFISHLLKNDGGVAELGMISKGAECSGALSEAKKASAEYSLSAFVSSEVHQSIMSALSNGDINYLKNLLK